MKKLLSLLLLGNSYLYAQDEPLIQIIPSPAVYRNELGVMVQNGGRPDNPDNVGLMGLQYKHFKNERLGWRAFVGYGNYQHDDGLSTIRVGSDTFYRKSTRTFANLPMAGIGLEAQRHFYRSIYFFAALELKMGYGNGRTDTMFEKTYGLPEGYGTAVSIYGQGDKVSAFYTALTPTIGAKARLKRVGVSIELLPVIMSYKNISYTSQPSYSLFNFSMGDMFTRLSISYLF